MTTYAATVAREGKWWMVRIPALGGTTQARRLAEAADMAREFVAVTLDVGVDDVAIDLTIEPVAGIDVLGRLTDIRDARQRAAEIERAAASDAIALAKQLAAAGLPRRDIGTMLGISFQRADQLVRS